MVSMKVQSLCSTQEEADTKIILHCQHAAEDQQLKGCDIVVRSPDTDVFILLIHYKERIGNVRVMFDTGIGDKRRMIDIGDVIAAQDKDFAKYIIGLHSMTGCDTTSAFVRKGKIRPFKLAKSQQKFANAFAALGDEVDISESVKKILEEFVCHLYGDVKETSINKLRYKKARQKFTAAQFLSSCEGTDMTLLPPSQAALTMHIKRANYQALVWKNAHVPNLKLPGPAEGHGWGIGDNGLEYDWCEGPFLPQVRVMTLTIYHHVCA